MDLGDGRVNDNARGAAFMMASMAGYILNDTFLKLVFSDIGFFQSIFLRGLFVTSLVLILAWHFGALRYRPGPSDRWLIALRVTGEVGGTLCYLTALSYQPIADATAILQVLPLTVTLGAALFLREAVGWRRMSAILIGFLGVLLIVRPGAQSFEPAALWAVAAVVFLTLRDIVTRSLSRDVPSLFVTLMTASVITILALLLSPLQAWQPVSMPQLGLLAAAAFCLFFGYFCGVLTMRTGEISFVSPFRYSILIWSILLGIFVFGDWPDGMTIAGATIVVVTGVYTFYRERRLLRSPNITNSSR